MTIFQTTQVYASQLEITYDEQKQKFLGELVSKGGIYRVEGPDRASVMIEMDTMLREEYYEMLRNAKHARVRDGGGGRSRGGGGGGSNERVEGVKVYTFQAGQRPRLHPKTFGTMVEMALTALSIAQGQWIEALLGTLGHKMIGWDEGLESHWDKKPEVPIFAVSFGGILIKAKSKKELKKKLRRQMNKRIHRIMSAIKKHKKQQEESALGGLLIDIKRFKKKKKRALEDWKMKVSKNGKRVRGKDWRERTLGMRHRLEDKRDIAKSRWSERVI